MEGAILIPGGAFTLLLQCIYGIAISTPAKSVSWPDTSLDLWRHATNATTVTVQFQYSSKHTHKSKIPENIKNYIEDYS